MHYPLTQQVKGFMCNFEMHCIYEKTDLPDKKTDTVNNQI